MKKAKDATQLFAALATLFPGDHIHTTSPISKRTQSSLDKVDAIEKAQAKRIRKQRKAAAILKKISSN